MRVVGVAILLSACDVQPLTVDPCARVDCSGHGACVETPEGAACDCDDGFIAEGTSCRALCEGISCSGFGTCTTDPAGEEVCDCYESYAAEGLTCVPTCEGNDCSGHGTCSTELGTHCDCDPGWWNSTDFDCVPDPTCVTEFLDVANEVRAAASDGATLYVATDVGLWVLDLGYGGRYGNLLGGPARAVLVAGRTVYVGEEESLKVWEFVGSDTVEATIAGLDGIRSVALALDAGFVATAGGQLHVLQAASLVEPTERAVLEWGASLRAVATDGSFAYVVGAEGGLGVVDAAADPPERLADVALDGNLLDADITGDVIYVAAGDAGVHVLYAPAPEAPELVETVTMDLGPTGVASWQEGFLAAGALGLAFFRPVDGAWEEALQIPFSAEAHDVTVSSDDRLAVVALSDGAATVDLACMGF